MYEPTQGLQYLAQTPPSTTPSPGQPHQTYHQAAQPSTTGGHQGAYAPQTQQAYPMICPVLHPSQLVSNHYYPAAPQHQQGQFHVVMPPAAHPTQ